MSLKQNIDMVKEELNSEEQFFEKAVITEKFVKKYKKPLIGAVVAVVLIAGANFAYEINKQNTITAANVELASLQKNPKDIQAATSLQALSPELFAVWSYSQAVVNKDTKTLKKLSSSKTLIINDLAKYEAATQTKDLNGLNSYAMDKDAIFKDLAVIQSAVILLNENKVDEAHAKLSQISINSQLSQVASALMHYGVK